MIPLEGVSEDQFETLWASKLELCFPQSLERNDLSAKHQIELKSFIERAERTSAQKDSKIVVKWRAYGHCIENDQSQPIIKKVTTIESK